MILQKIVEHLQKLHPKEIDLSLDRTKDLCQKLGNPQDQIDSISIVGTNGKYSTIKDLYAILKEANDKCNIYTSPHIQKINERIVFNNKPLTDDELANLLSEVEEINNVNIVGNVWDLTTTENIKGEIRLAGGSYLCSPNICHGTQRDRELFVDKETANTHISLVVYNP